MPLLDSNLTRISPEPTVDSDVPGSSALRQSLYKRDWIGPLLSRAQKYSAYGFSVFLGIHACLVIIAPALPLDSGSFASQTFSLARAVYLDIPGFEPIMIYGSLAIHLASGILGRFWRAYRGYSKPRTPRADVVIRDGSRLDVGLGGVLSVFGLGYRTASITRWVPGLLPLAFSGYVLIPLIAAHMRKFKFLPMMIDGDLSNVALEYVAYSVNQCSELKVAANYVLLYALVLVTSYHVVSGWLRYGRKFSLQWKRTAYAMIATAGVLAWSSLRNISKYFGEEAASGFLATTYSRYTAAFL